MFHLFVQVDKHISLPEPLLNQFFQLSFLLLLQHLL